MKSFVLQALVGLLAAWSVAGFSPVPSQLPTQGSGLSTRSPVLSSKPPLVRQGAFRQLKMQDGEPPKRTTGFGTFLGNIKKEYDENPQQTLIKLFFFPLSPLFFPVPLTILYQVYKAVTGGPDL